MNKTFKVVFNKARGALMVANEMTSSVQAKGTRTVIAATMAATVIGMSTVAAASTNPTTISEDTTITLDGSKMPAYQDESVTLENGATLTLEGVTNQHGFLGGTTGTSIAGDGNLVLNSKGTGDIGASFGEKLKDVNVNSIKITSECYGIYKSNLGVVSEIQAKTIDVTAADTAFYTSGPGVAFKNFDSLALTSTVEGHAINNNSASTVSFQGGNVELTAASRGALSNMGTGSTIFDVDNLTVKTLSTKEEGARKQSAVYAEQGTINAVAKNTISITANKGDYEAFGVYATGGGKVLLKANNVEVKSDNNGLRANANSSVEVMGKTIDVGVGDNKGYAVLGCGGTVNIGDSTTESVTLTGSGFGIWAFHEKKMAEAAQSTVNVKAKRINISSDTFGVHAQNGTEFADVPAYRSSINLTADEITVNSKNLGLSAFSNGRIDVTGNLMVEAPNAIDVRGNSTMNINTDGQHTTALKGDVVFETPNSPGDSQNSGKIINADVNLGLHGDGSVWTGRSYQEYQVGDGDGKHYVQSVELVNPPYYGNVTGFKTEISNGGQWNVTGDSFVNTLTLSDGGVVIGGAEAKKLNVEHFTLSGANNTLKLAKDAELTVSDGKIKFENGASLITNFDTAYKNLTTDADGAVTGADAKLAVEVEGKDKDASIVMDDAFVYTAAGLESLAGAYTKQGIGAVYLTNGTAKVGETLELVGGIVNENQHVQATTDSSGNIVRDGLAGAASIKVVDGSNNPQIINEVSISSDLVLVGDADNKHLIQNANGDSVSKVVVQEDANLNLGSISQAKATFGKLPELEIGTGQLVVENIVASVKKLIASSGAEIYIGSDKKAGALHADTLDLSQAGSFVFIDPAFTPNGTISDASFLTAGSLVDSTVANTVIVGQNSVAAFHATQADAVTAFNKMGKTWGTDVTAALYLGQAVNVTGSLMVDGMQTASPGEAVGVSSGELDVLPGVTIAAKGMLMLDQPAIGSATAIDGHLTFADGSYLGVVNTLAGTTTLATEVTGSDVVTVVTDNPFFVGSVNGNVLTTEVSTSGGMAAIGSTGIQAMTRRADSHLARSIADRTALDQEMAQGTNLWVDVTGERYEADKLDHNGSFRSDMGYGAFGADVVLTKDMTAGAAVQYGKGSLRSSVAFIKNDIDNYGFDLYGSVKLGEDAKIVGELAYVKSTNDITSSQTALNQKVDADMYSAGVTAQYRLTAGNFQFVPSVGVRVSRLETDAMQVGAVSIDKQKQTIVQVPVALRVNGVEQGAGGWKLAPSAKVAVVPTFGDKDITVFGVDQTVIDTSPVQADLGIRAANGNLMINANFLLGGGKDGASAVGGKVGLKYVF